MGYGRIKRAVFESLDPTNKSGTLPKIIDSFLVALILLNCAAIIIESIPEI